MNMESPAHDSFGAPKLHLEAKEQFPFKILGKVTFMRHGDTEYTEQYPDLTELGIQQVTAGAKDLNTKIDREKEDVFIASSPKVRAQGTADIVKRELEIGDVRIVKAMRSVEARNWEEALKMVNEIIGPEKDVKKMDRAYAHDAAFEERVDVWEPRSDVEKRFFRGFAHLTRIFERYERENLGKIPHFIGVSHFETLNHLAGTIFNIRGPEADTLNFAEKIEITVLKREEGSRYLPLLVTYRGETKEVVLDRDTRTLEIARDDHE